MLHGSARIMLVMPRLACVPKSSSIRKSCKVKQKMLVHIVDKRAACADFSDCFFVVN